MLTFIDLFQKFFPRLILAILLCLVCTVSAEAATKIYFTENGPTVYALQRANTDGTSIEVVAPDDGFNAYYELAVDANTNTLYFTDRRNTGTSGIYKVALGGTFPVTPTLVLAVPNIKGFALDITNGHIYFSETANYILHRCNLDGTGQTTMIPDDGTWSVADLWVDTTNGALYIATASGAKEGIVKIALASLPAASTASLTNILTSATSPNSIFGYQGKLYYNDFSAYVVKRMNFDGTGIETLIPDDGTWQPEALYIDDASSTLYLSEATNTNSIRKITLASLPTATAGANALTQVIAKEADGIFIYNDIPADSTPPTISAVSIPNSTMKVGDAVTATITVTSDPDNYTTGSGSISGTIGNFALGSLSKTNDTTYTASFTVIEGGTDVAAGSNIPVNFTLTDSAGNTSSAFSTAISQVSDPIDANSPTVTAHARQTPATAITNADAVTFRATFSENVQNVDTTDFSLSGTASGDGTVNSVTPVSLSVYDVEITGLTSSNGTVNLDIIGGHNIQDTAGNALSSTVPTGADETYTLDNNAPGLTSFARQIPATSPTNADTLVFRAAFDDDVQNVDTFDFTVSGTTATVTGLAVVSANTVFDITVSGGDLAGFNGIVGLNLAGGQNISDAVGNALPPGEPGTDETYLLDNTAPTVFSINRSGSTPTNAASVNFTVTFDGTVSDIETGDFQLAVTGTASGSVSSVSSASGSSITATVNTISGDGTLGLNFEFARLDSVVDAAGNAAAADFTGQTYTIDNTAPTVTINQAGGQTDPSTSTPINFTIIFNEPVTGFDNATDVILSGTAGATTAVITGTGPYNVAVSGMTATGTVIANINAGVAQDAAGNLNAASTSTDNQVTYSPPPPSVVSINRTDLSPTNAPSVDFTITFDQMVSGIDTADFSLATVGTTGTIASVSAGSGTSVTVTVNSITGNGTLGLNLVDNDTIVNSFGNSLGGAGVGNGNYTGQLYTISPIPSAVTTNAATAVSTMMATLNGTVNASYTSTTVTFEYGTTTAYGTTVTADQNPVIGAMNTAVSKSIYGLAPTTTYHYRVVGVNLAGTTNGADMTFTTSPIPYGMSYALDDPFMTGMKRSDGGDSSNNLDTGTGNPKIDLGYEFRFMFKDASATPPASVKLVLDGHTYEMNMIGGTIADGALYSLSLKLGPMVGHSFHFEIRDGVGSVLDRLPAATELAGPVVELLNGPSMVGLAKDMSASGLDLTQLLNSSSIYEWVSAGLTTDVNNGSFTALGNTDYHTPGLGYFVVRENSTLADLSAEPETLATTITFDLSSGWNMISNPYGGYINLIDVQVQRDPDPAVSWAEATTNRWLTNSIYTYLGSDWGGSYTFESAGGIPEATLVPWTGYWVYVIRNDASYRLIFTKP